MAAQPLAVSLNDRELREFTEHVAKDGYLKDKPQGDWEVVRMVNPEIEGEMRTIILYKRSDGKITIPIHVISMYRAWCTSRGR